MKKSIFNTSKDRKRRIISISNLNHTKYPRDTWKFTRYLNVVWISESVWTHLELSNHVHQALFWEGKGMSQGYAISHFLWAHQRKYHKWINVSCWQNMEWKSANVLDQTIMLYIFFSSYFSSLIHLETYHAHTIQSNKTYLFIIMSIMNNQNELYLLNQTINFTITIKNTTGNDRIDYE